MPLSSGQVLPDVPMFGRGLPGPDTYSLGCARAADGMRQAGGFGEPELWRFDWERPYTRDEWLDQMPTFGGWSQIPPAAQRDLLAGVGRRRRRGRRALHDGIRHDGGHRGAHLTLSAGGGRSGAV